MKTILATCVAAVIMVAATPAAMGLPAHPQGMPAPMTVRTGACTGDDPNAVIVVIDYQGLGGGVAQYCVSNLAQGTTGLQALQAAGVSVQGTTHDGASFACRINGKPSASQTLTLPNGEQYVETCVNTPPTTAYWSYWWAKPGGSWSYTSQGATTRAVVFGSYEGWSFSLGGGIGSAPAPHAATPAWAAPVPPPAPPPAPVPATTSAAPPPAQQPTSTKAAPRQPASSASSDTAGEPAAQESSDETVGSPTPSATQGSSHPTAVQNSAPTPSFMETSPSSTPAEGEGSDGEHGSGPGVGVIIGLVLIAGVAVGTGVVTFLRKRKGEG